MYDTSLLARIVKVVKVIDMPIGGILMRARGTLSVLQQRA